MSTQDYSIRIPASPERIQLLEGKTTERKLLPRIKDFMFRPKGTKLSNYRPDEICVRLREFVGEEKPSTLVKITTTKTPPGYTDEKEKLGEGSTPELLTKAEQLGYEKWGEMSTTSTEYLIKFSDGSTTSVLSQEIKPVGTYLKIESPTEEGLKRALDMLSATKNERIAKNAAFLLAEKSKLI